MIINKIIHYGLFGGWKPTALDERCMATWHRILPEFEFKLWTDENGPKDRRFFSQALKSKPVNCSNYIKYWALFEFGGIFLDNDVEVLRLFDLALECFLGFQRSDTMQDCINTAVIGSRARHPFIGECLNQLDADNGDTWPVWAGCGLPTEELIKMGLNGLNIEQTVGDVTVYSKERFYPWFFNEAPERSRITDRTFACHHFQGSWSK